MRIHRPESRRGWAALLWGLAFFVAGQVALTAYMDRRHPEMRDPNYGYKMAVLRPFLKANAGRPLVLFVGSSRTLAGLRPELLPACQIGGVRPAVFNFGVTGNGPPLYNLINLRRLLDEGVQPDWVFLEVLPYFLSVDIVEANENLADQVFWSDLPLLCRYMREPVHLYRLWWQAHLLTGFSHRLFLANRYVFSRITGQPFHDERSLPLDRGGWFICPVCRLGADEYRRRYEHARQEYEAGLGQLHLVPGPDRALRDFLDLCRARGIHVGLYLMPEGKDFQRWYSPAGRAEIDAYLARLSREYHVPLVDARDWNPASDFLDGHHLLPCGTARFTRRFGREVLRPLLEGEPHATASGAASARR